MAMAIGAMLGLGALLVLLAAVLPAVLQPDFETVDRDFVQDGTCKASALESFKLTCPTISEQSKELFRKEGVVVLREAVDPAVIAELAAEVECRMKPKTKAELWALSAPNVWMDSDVFAKFVLHRDSLLGCLAAQLIPNATTIRYAGEEVTMLFEGQSGSAGWSTDAVPSNLSDPAPLKVPLVRFFLPLGPQNLSNVTGGSLTIIPLSAFAKMRKFFPPCFDGKPDLDMVSNGEIKFDCAIANGIAFAPALGLGDMLLYSPLVPHKTQQLLTGAGSRVALHGGLYEPKLLVPWVHAMPPPKGTDAERFKRQGSMRYDVFCLDKAACWDHSTQQCHHNATWLLLLS